MGRRSRAPFTWRRSSTGSAACGSSRSSCCPAGSTSIRRAGASCSPRCLAGSYAFAGFGRPRPHEYTRTSSPTRDQLAETLAKLEGGAAAALALRPARVGVETPSNPLLRLSVGLEAEQDLIEDLAQALTTAAGARP